MAATSLLLLTSATGVASVVVTVVHAPLADAAVTVVVMVGIVERVC